jgi:PAS domain S-box-containing protein
MPSSAEIVYTLQGVADDLREDGRGRLDFRHLSLEIGLFPQANGSARLCTGGADVLVGVSAVLSVPKPSAPDLGKITISVSCGPGDAAARALPEYVAGAGVDDKRVWLEWSLNANNTEGIIYAAGQDLTLRILYDEELRNQNERFRLLREAANEGIYDWDIRRDEYDWGDSFTKLTGHSTIDIALNHDHWLSFIFSADKDRILNNQHAATFSNSKYWHEEYQYRCADGSYKYILDRGIFIYDESGNAIRLIGTMQDITALKQSEESLIQLNEALQHRAQQLLGFNKELEQFAYIVSHDLQEPLRMISSFMQLLLNSKEIHMGKHSIHL